MAERGTVAAPHPHLHMSVSKGNPLIWGSRSFSSGYFPEREGEVGSERSMKTASRNSFRVASIDAARGAAMLFVCLAHFANAYHFLLGEDTTGTLLVTIGMIASPTFVTVSGTVAGFLWVTRRSFFPHLRRRLVDRGLFLLLIGHVVLASSGFFAKFGIVQALTRSYITDAIAIAVIVGPWLITRLTIRWRLVLAATIFSLDWLAIVFWAPSEGVAVFVKHYFVGIISPAEFGIAFSAFPAIPWLAVYLIGTTVGEAVGKRYVARDKQGGHLLLAKIGASAFGVGIAGKVVAAFLRHLLPEFAQRHDHAMSLLSSYQKFPPGPTYILFFAGAGMLMVSAVLESDRRGYARMLRNPLRELGEASLFVYAIQFYLYTLLLPSLHLHYSPLWPLVFVASLAILAFAATLWNRASGNRWLTIGVTALLERRASRLDAEYAVLAAEASSPTVQLPPTSTAPLSQVRQA